MVDPYIRQQVKEVIEREDFPFPLNHAMAGAWIMAHFKGFNIKVYDVAPTSSLADYYVVGSTENKQQAIAVTESLKEVLKSHEASFVSVEGEESADWILADTGDVIFHLFSESNRDIYDLDQLWHHYPQVTVPEEFYIPKAPKEAVASSDQGRGANSKDYY